MKSPLLWSCLVLLGVLLSWLLWFGQEPSFQTEQESTPPQTETRRADEKGVLSEENSRPSAEDIRERVDSKVPTMRIRVLYKVDRTPVSGSTVTAREAKGSTKATKTDATGTVVIPCRAERYIVEATYGDMWGMVYVNRAAKKPYEILLEKDHELRARVCSESTGAPVTGVLVGLRRFSLYGLPFEAAFERTADPDGIATFHHVQRHLNRQGRWQVFLGVPLRKQSFAPLSMAKLPTEPVELVLPDTGSVVVKVHDEDQATVDTRKLHFQLSVFPTENRVKPMTIGSYTSLRPDDEQVRYAPMGLGLFLRVRVSSKDRGSRHRPVTVDIEGPKRPGETVTSEVLWRSDKDPEALFPLVLGRLVHRDKSPWPKAKIHVYPWIFPTPKSHTSSQNIELSNEGRFRLVLREPWPEGGKRIYRFWTEAKSEFGALEARLDLSRKLPPGETDIGDVLLDLGQLLVNGRVVDAEGMPLPKARLSLTQRVMANEKELWPGVDCVGRFAIAKDGSFALHAIPGMELPAGRLRLKVACAEMLPAEPIEFPMGTKGLRVVLQAGGAVEGSVRLAPGQAPLEIAVAVHVGGRVFSTHLKKDGTFHRGGLPAGQGKLTAWSRAGHVGRASRVVIEDLVIQPGVTNRDPRIQDLVVADRRTGAQVEVFGEDGEPLVRALVRRSGATTYTDYKGQCIVEAKKFPVEVSVTAFGYAQKKVSLKEGKNKVVLARGMTIELHTTATTIGKDPDYHLGFLIYHVDPKGGVSGHVYGRTFPYNRRYFNETGKASVPVPGAGTYEVQPWVFIHGKDNVGRGGVVGKQPFQRIHVMGGKASQRFEIHVPAGLLADAVRRFAK